MTRRLTFDYYSGDREQGQIRSEFYTTEQLGPKQSMTAEGFLLCEDVPLARPGEMIYGPNETPIEAGDDGLVHITRGEDELFRPETIASFNGKPVTNEHPPEDVTPANWHRYAKGTLMNVRRGTGDTAGLLVGDLLVTDPETIRDIRGDKREVSLGYDADYKKTGPGRGQQSNILGNHVALVDRGRCGPRCAINDHDSLNPEKELDMPQAINTGGTTRRYLNRDAVRRVLDNAMLEVERMQGGEQQSLSKDAEGEYGKDLTGGGVQNIHIHLEGSTAPAGQTEGILMEGGDQTADNFPSGPEYPLNPDAGNSPGRMQQVASQDDPTEMRFQRIESVLAQILQHLQGAGGSGEDMGHGEPDGDEPGSAGQAPGARAGESDRFGDSMSDDEAAEIEEEANTVPSGDKCVSRDAARKMRDSAPLEVSYRQLASDAEILFPGYRIPTFDAATHPVDTVQFMCNTRKRALDMAYMTATGKAAIDQVMRNRAFDSSVMDCKCLRKTFDSAVGIIRAWNNAPAFRAVDNSQQVVGQPLTGAPRSVEELNAFMKSHYKQH